MSRPSAFIPIPNGPGAAAVLAAATGCLALGCFAFAGDAIAAVQRAFIFWPPTGALSGVTTSAIAVWLATWIGLSRRWKDRNVPMAGINRAAFVMLTLGLLLTFPPFMDMLQGK